MPPNAVPDFNWWLNNSGVTQDTPAPLAPQPGESVWGHFARSAAAALAPAIKRAGLNAFPGSGLVSGPTVAALNSPWGGPPTKADPSAPTVGFDLSSALNAPLGSTPAGGPTGFVGDPHSDPVGFFSGIVGKKVTINSGQRSAAHNAAVGGVPGSQHLTGDAWDIAVPGMSGADLAAKIAASGVPYHQLIVEGNGVHFGAPKGVHDGQYMLRHGGAHDASYSVITPLVSPGSDPYTAGPQVAVDPATAMGMIPAAHLLQHITLPTPTPMELPAPLTPEQQINKAAFLAPLTAASQVKPLDTKNNAWERVAAGLSGAASAMAGEGRAPLVSQLLLAGGGAFGSSFKGEKDKQDAEQKQYDEMVRSANIALAQAGMNVDLHNLDTTNRMIERTDARGDQVRQVKFENAQQRFNTLVEQAKMNLGISESNVGALNSRDMARAQVGVAALDQGAAAQNAGTNTQTQLNLEKANAGNSGQAIQATTGRILDQYSIPRPSQQGKDDPINDNAREAAQAMASVSAGGANADAATKSMLGNLAREMVMNGTYASQLAPKTAASVKKVLEIAGPGKVPPAQAIAQAQALVTAELTADIPGAARIAQFLAKTNGSPVARMLADRVRARAATAN